MILHDLISRMNREMRNNPGVTVDEDDKVALINEVMLRVLGDEPWRFLMRRPEITIYADYTGPPATFTLNSRVVNALGATVFLEWMEGQKVTGPDGLVYRVAGIDLTDGLTLYLDRNYEGVTASSSTSWTIEHDRLQLPRDCIDYYGMVDRSGRHKVTTISAREEEYLQLGRDDGGDVTMVLDELAEFYEPIETVLVATAITGTSLAAGKYEYCQTIEEFGRENHGTMVATATATASLQGIRITNLVGQAHQRARVYRRSVTNRGGWYLLKVYEPGATIPTNFDDDGPTFTLDTTVKLQADGPTEYLRVYRKPAADTTLELRYLAKPRRMISANDAPQMPEQYHQILWRLGVAELHGRKGATGQSKFHIDLAQERIDSMRRKYLDRADRVVVKGQMPAGGSRWATRYGTPTKS